MKKICILISVLIFSLQSYGEIFLSEDFSGNQMPPPGWSIENYSSRWTVEPSNEAGGEAPEARFALWPEVDTTRLISPTIDLTGQDTVVLNFKHYLWDYSGNGYQIGVATRSNPGDTWEEVWSKNPNGNIGPEQRTVVISNSSVGSSEFQFCFYVKGDLYNLNYWYIDDIWLFEQLDLDAGMQVINTPTYLVEPTPVEGIIKNFGQSYITSITIKWQIDDNPIKTTLLTNLSIPFAEQYNFTCNGLIDLPPGTYTLKVWIDNVNYLSDDDPSNDLLEKTIHVASHAVQHRPCIEEFTSSTCVPCAGFNEQFDLWASANANEITLVKYQMNWPGSGDPYYTPEGGVRRDFYNVIGVPTTFLDGKTVANSIPAIQQAFNTSVDDLGLAKIAGSHTLSGTIMDLDITVLPFAAINDLSIYVIVFEYLTHNNATSNGETEFHHVMMKMIPDAYGSSVSLQDRVPHSIIESVDLSGTFVEEWDDLGVVVIIQDTISEYIYQSDYSYENASYGSDASLSDLTADGITVPGFSPDIFDYNITLPAGTSIVPTVEATTNDTNAISIIVPAAELPGTTTIDVFAENLVSHNQYTVNFSLEVGINDVAAKKLNIFPNPSSGQLFITGAENADITIYNVYGSVVYSFNNLNSNIINLDGLENGIYILRVTYEDNSIITKRISLTK
ncbi:MAG: T9SS type A sorting domain-containing protein [Bacteroidota bacterium]